ncbi:MAG TPA: glycosyltransferase family 4 protein [Chloroflexota bacterium]|nr:glycosyltransferase family 4 protein [Chloroflexota bacterium]
MKVLVLSDYYPPNTKGGADIAAERLSAEIAHRGHSVCALTTVQEKSQAVSDTIRGVQVHRFYSSYPIELHNYMAVYNPMVVGQVRKKIEEFKPDVVHAHNVHTHLSFQTLLEAKKRSIPVILSAHDHQLFCSGKFDCLPPEKATAVTVSQCAHCQQLRFFPLRNRLIRHRVEESGARILAVSAALRDDLVANGFAPETVGVMHNGIDPNSMAVSDEHVRMFALRHELVGKKVILFGGRVSHAKGIDQAVSALGRLPRDLNFVFLVLGSSEDYISYILQLGHRLSVEDRTVFLPWLSGEDLKAAYAISDVCLTPSMYREPFNLINIEAMALKKPVITTCFGGPPEVVVDGVTGYVLDPRNADLMAARLMELLSDERKAKAMGEAGYRRVEEKFTVAYQADQTLAAYAAALENQA